MKNIQEYTQEQLDEKLKELHQELSRIKPAINSLEKIASDSGSILQYQSNTARGFKSIVNDFSIMANTLPEFTKNEITSNLKIIENEVGVQSENLALIVEKQSLRLNNSFAKIEELIQAINGISEGLGDVELETILSNQGFKLFDDLKGELKQKLDKTVIEFEKEGKRLSGCQSKVIKSIGDATDELNKITSSIPAITQEGLTNNLQLVESELTKQTVELGLKFKNQIEVLDKSFTQIAELLELIDGLPTVFKNFDFEKIVGSEINLLLDGLKKRLEQKFDHILKDFERKSLLVIDNHTKVIEQLKETRLSVENQVKSISSLHEDIVGLELADNLSYFRAVAINNEDKLKDISCDLAKQMDEISQVQFQLGGLKELKQQISYGNEELFSKISILNKDVEELKGSNDQILFEIQSVAKEIKEKAISNDKLLRGNRIIGILNLVVASGIGISFILFALKYFNFI